MEIDIAVSNNFAFGGANASIVFARAGARPQGPPTPALDRVVITGLGALTTAGTDLDALWDAYSGLARLHRHRGRRVARPRGLRAQRLPHAQGAQARRRPRALLDHRLAQGARGRGARADRREPHARGRDPRHGGRPDGEHGGLLRRRHRGRRRTAPTPPSSPTPSTTPPAGRWRSKSAPSAPPRPSPWGTPPAPPRCVTAANSPAPTTPTRCSASARTRSPTPSIAAYRELGVLRGAAGDGAADGASSSGMALAEAGVAVLVERLGAAPGARRAHPRGGARPRRHLRRPRDRPPGPRGRGRRARDAPRAAARRHRRDRCRRRVGVGLRSRRRRRGRGQGDRAPARAAT